MKELTIDQIKILQSWIDKLADMQSDFTENKIIEWAKSLPIKDIKDADYAPLYLFGDSTLDKAITDIISGDDSGAPAQVIESVLKKNFCMDCSVVDIMPFNANKEINPVIDLSDQFVKVTCDAARLDNLIQYIKDNDYLNCEYEEREDGLYLKTKDSIPVTQKLMKVNVNFNRGYKKVFNTRNFSYVEENELAKNPDLKKMGYKVIDYSEIQWLLTNENESYIITKDTPNDTIEVEDMEGNINYFTNLDDFVRSIKGSRNYSNSEKLRSVIKNFSKKNYAESNKKQLGICWFNEDLTDILDHYEIDSYNTKSEHSPDYEYVKDCLRNNRKGCMLHQDYLVLFNKDYNKYDYYRARIVLNETTGVYECYLPSDFINKKELNFLINKFLLLNNISDSDVLSKGVIFLVNSDYNRR